MSDCFCYNASHYIMNSNVYNLINKALNIQLKNNCDEYHCEDYSIMLETNMIFIYFRVPDMYFIRWTMKKITDAMDLDESGWDYNENLYETIYDKEFSIDNDIDYTIEQSQFLNTIAEFINKQNLEETSSTDRVKILIQYYQYLIVNTEKFYTSISNKNVPQINKLINIYILKAGKHKNEISQLNNIPTDISNDAIYIINWATELLQKILDTHNTSIDI